MSDFIDRPCATAFVCPMSAFVDRPSQEQEKASPELNHSRSCDTKATLMELLLIVPQYYCGIN